MRGSKGCIARLEAMNTNKWNAFAPKHSVLRITHDGVAVEILKMDSDQARRLLSVLSNARQQYRLRSDADVVELIIASIQHDLDSDRGL